MLLERIYRRKVGIEHIATPELLKSLAEASHEIGRSRPVAVTPRRDLVPVSTLDRTVLRSGETRVAQRDTRIGRSSRRTINLRPDPMLVGELGLQNPARLASRLSLLATSQAATQLPVSHGG